MTNHLAVILSAAKDHLPIDSSRQQKNKVATEIVATFNL
jgi:hypothetical protein